MANDAHLNPEETAGSEPVGDRVRLYRRGRVWYANFQHGGKQHRVSLKTGSKKEARRRAVRIENELETGRWKPAPVTATVDEAVAAYRDFLRAEERAPKTLRKYDTVFRRLSELAKAKKVNTLDGITLKFLDAYRRLRADEGAQAKTRYVEAVIIRQLINFALARDMVAADPLKGLKLKKPKPTPQPCWSYQQVQQILAKAAEEAKPALILLAETGMRFGELAWLTWDDVDLAANVLHVRPKEGWRPKTGDRRSIPLSPVARRVLESLPRRWRWVVTMPPSRRHPQPGRQWTERRLLAALKRVLTKLKLPGKLHTFRHFFISNALQRGTAEATVRKWVGQVDEGVLKLYTHIHDSASQAAMQRLAEATREELQSEGTSDERKDGERTSAQIQHPQEEDQNGQDTK